MGEPALFLFHCDRLQTRLTTVSCALRWAGANDRNGPPHLTSSACHGCPIGEGNAKGQGPAAPRAEKPQHRGGRAAAIAKAAERAAALRAAEKPRTPDPGPRTPDPGPR